MLGHFRLHASLLAVAGALLVTGACTSASPRVTVLGVEQTHRTPRRSLLVFVEVVNPGDQDLRLSRLEYKVRADSWFESAGQVRLAREIGAGQTAVVEIPVPVQLASAGREGTIPYTLDGKLFALENHVERSWKVAVRGALGHAAGDRNSPIRVTVVSQ